MNIDNPFLRAIGAVVLVALAYYFGSTEAAVAAFAATLYGEYARPGNAVYSISQLVQQNWRRTLPLLSKRKILEVVTIVTLLLCFWLFWKVWKVLQTPSFGKPMVHDSQWPSWPLPSLSAPSMPDWLLPVLAALAALAALAVLINWLRKRRPVAVQADAQRRQYNWRQLAAGLALIALLALLLTQCDGGNGKKPEVRAPAPSSAASTPTAPKPVVTPVPAKKWAPKVFTTTAVKGDGGIRMVAKLYDKKNSLTDALELAKKQGWAKKVRGKWVVAPMVQPNDVWTATERKDGGYDLTVRHATRHKY